MMTRGAIDAIIAPRAPKAFMEGDKRVRRLFDDVKAVEQAYFRKTGIFPPMHIIGIRNGLLEREPAFRWLREGEAICRPRASPGQL